QLEPIVPRFASVAFSCSTMRNTCLPASCDARTAGSVAVVVDSAKLGKCVVIACLVFAYSPPGAVSAKAVHVKTCTVSVSGAVSAGDPVYVDAGLPAASVARIVTGNGASTNRGGVMGSHSNRATGPTITSKLLLVPT